MAHPSPGEDRAEIHDLLSRFAFLADDGDLADLGALFAADGVWESGRVTWHGREEIVAGLGKYRADGLAGPGSGVRHVVTTVEVGIDGPERAHARCYVLVTGTTEDAAARLMLVSQYQDVLRREDGAWRFGHRRFVP